MIRSTGENRVTTLSPLLIRGHIRRQARIWPFRRRSFCRGVLDRLIHHYIDHLEEHLRHFEDRFEEIKAIQKLR